MQPISLLDFPFNRDLAGLAKPYMAQSDSQRPEFEEIDSSNLDSVIPADGGGEGLEPAKIDGKQTEAPKEPPPETFGAEVEDMLGSIDTDPDPFGDESLVIDEAEEELNAEEAISEVAESVGEVDLDDDDLVAADIRDEVAAAFVEEDEEENEALEDLGSSLPTPEELLAQAGSLLNGGEFQLPVEEAEKPEDEALDELEGDELTAMPDPQSLMSQAGEGAGTDANGGGEGLEPAKIDGKQTNAPKDPPPETFGAEVEDMLGSIDTDTGPDPFGDESLVIDESEEELNAEEAISEVAESAGEVDLDDDDLVAADIRDEVAAAFVEEDEQENEALEDLGSSLPTPEELLAQAGSLLNGGDFQLPVEEAEKPEDEALDELEGDELTAMPDPQSLMSQADAEVANSESEEVEEEEGIELMAMPDPQALMNAASDNPDDVPDLPKPKPGSSIADRAGDLPPPPPAPVCLDDSEVFVEEEVVEPEEPEVPVAVESDDSVSDSPEPEEPSAPPADDSDDVSSLMDDDDLIAAGSSLDEFNVGSAEADGKEVVAASTVSLAGPGSSLNSGSHRGVVGRVLQSTALAAGLLFVGLGLTLAFVKDELYGFLQSGDIEGSALSWHVTAIAKQVFEELEETRHYQVNDFNTEIRQVSDTEVLIEVKMEAHLASDLYLPVEDALIYSQIEFVPSDLEEAALFVSEEYPENSLMPPEQPWEKLYQLSAHKGERFPLVANFRLTRETAQKPWTFSNLHIEGGDSNFVWGEGEVVDLHDDSSMEVGSLEFQYRLRTYQLAGESFLNDVKVLENQIVAEENERERQRDERRARLATSLSKGSYFKGMAIAGEDGADAQEVSMLITETRNEGGLIKGILKLGSDQKHAKHFTGILDIVEKNEDGPQALLSLTTIAFDDQPAGEAPVFFKPGTVSRLALKTDGYRMEGDGAEISLRLIRSM